SAKITRCWCEKRARHEQIAHLRIDNRAGSDKLAGISQLRNQKTLRLETKSLISFLPNFARACGRVSIGGHPDKRPDSRLRRRLHFLAPATGSRRRTGQPRSPRGTRLKATTERAFLESRRQCRIAEEACPSLPGVRIGSLPSGPRQQSRVTFGAASGAAMSPGGSP